MRYEDYIAHLREGESNTLDVYRKAFRLANELVYIKPRMMSKKAKRQWDTMCRLFKEQIAWFQDRMVTGLDRIRLRAENKHNNRNMLELPF